MKHMAEAQDDDDAPLLSRELSYVGGQSKIENELKQMTGLVTMQESKQKDDIHALEGRTLRERMARHAELREMLKEPLIEEEDSSDEEF